jgi:2'-5' RNA ligase
MAETTLPSGAADRVPTRRLFVGLFVDATAARELHTTVRGILAGAGFRFVPPEEIHLTLRFLPETQAARVDDLRAALEGALAGLPAPRLRIAHTGTFPESGSAQVLWAGVEEDPGTEGRLEALASAADAAAVASIGAPAPAEPFRPHITVARPSRYGRCLPPEDFRSLRLGVRWLPTEARLVESRPGSSGEARFPLIAGIGLLPDPA